VAAGGLLLMGLGGALAGAVTKSQLNSKALWHRRRPDSVDRHRG